MKKAIVVGATSGIGKELSDYLTINGYSVGITGRRTNNLSELKSRKPDQYFIKSFDISNTAKVKQNLDELCAELNGLDMLIICSGTGDLNEHLDFSIEKLTIDTNVSGFTAVADWAFNYFQKQKSGQLVAITSIAGLRGNRTAPAYNATKAYQINYLEGLRQKARKLNLPIFITDVRSGLVDTAMAKGNGLFWVAPVPKATKQIYYAIKAKRKVAYVTKRWKLIALFFKLIPRPIYERM